MRKFLRIFVVVVLIVFIVIQFFQPEKNRGEMTSDHIFKTENVPENIKVILQTSCFDCHSNNTNYLWYHHIMPVGWIINNDIKKGKDDLNFSEWNKMDIFDKLKTLDEINTEVKRKDMPMKAYVIMHPKAKLSDEQINELCSWTETLGNDLMKKAVE